MSEAILAAIITGSLSLAGTVLTVRSSGRRTDENLRVQQAVTDTKIDELTREVRKHNGFAEKMPVLEERIKVINHRIDDLEEITGQ